MNTPFQGVAGWSRRTLRSYRTTVYGMPPFILTVFFTSVILMNFFSNKEWFSVRYLAFDCGYAVSWISFLCMDMICKSYGGRAAFRVSVLAVITNLFFALLFYLLSIAPGHWNVFYRLSSTPEVAETVDASINAMVGGTWYVVFGSALAVLVSSAVNSLANNFVARHLHRDTYVNFAVRSLSSSVLAQIVDNMVFSTVVCHVFFGWTMTQVVVCSLLATAFEVVAEMLFTPVGYAICRRWEASGIARAYLECTGNSPLR